MDLSELRREYEAAGLDEAGAHPDPIEQFDRWYTEASEAGIELPNAVVLATSDLGGFPSARAVLLKGYAATGFDFYSNYDSAKGSDLATNPKAAMCFLWVPLHRQIRVEGIVRKTSPEQSDDYFASRPRGAQISAATSAQSSVIPSRPHLEDSAAAIERSIGDDPVPRPENWGGYRLVPNVFEFWQGRQDRLHDRLRYRRDGESWIIERLSP